MIDHRKIYRNTLTTVQWAPANEPITEAFQIVAFCSANLPQPTSPTLYDYMAYSDQLREWFATATRYGGRTFLDEKKYFVPVPVALFVCESGLLREVPAT
jgi:hypothetical protein